jgi:hypothetical protein
VQGSVTIWYRGATFQLGRGPNGYGIWALRGRPEHPVEQWPETPPGWAAAWSRFTALEPPGSIVHLSSPAAPAAGSAWRAGPPIASLLLAAGVICGVAGLFPPYLAGASLAHQPPDLVTHVIYLAAWTTSALLIQFGGRRARAAGLFGLGTSIVAFGFFLADAGTVMASGAHVLGLGLVLSLVSWLACTAGAVLAGQPWPAGSRRQQLGAARAVLVRRAVLVTGIGLLAVGAAAAFAPSWDSYTLRTSAGQTQTVTAGNIFANPAPVTAGDIAVMICFVVVAIVAAAAAGRPGRLAAALLAGAMIPMVAEVISAVIGISEHVSPTEFGISPGQAAQAGLTISPGLTAAFWVYCAFIAALAGICGWLLAGPRPRRGDAPGLIAAPVSAAR